MKKLWIVLLSLGLLAVFCIPASALDVTWKGTYIATGIYESNRSITDEGADAAHGGVQKTGASMAYYAQRLRMEQMFKVAEGLRLQLQEDLMTRVWGQQNVNAGTYGNPASARNTNDEQNIHIRFSKVYFDTKYGNFAAGYSYDSMWGTEFLDSWDSVGGSISWVLKTGPFLWLLAYEKIGEGRLGNATVATPGYTDSDLDKYCISGYYFAKWGSAGLIYCYLPNATAKPLGFDGVINVAMAYYRVTFGDFWMEAELDYGWGKDRDYDKASGLKDYKYAGWAWYAKARYTLGPAYVGAQYAHLDGDDPDSVYKRNSYSNSGNQYQPCLILWNDWTNRFSGNLGTNGQVTNYVNNVNMYQVFAGFRPMPEVHIFGSFTLAKADERPLNYIDKDYGKELDITASYKIFDNLEYMVGFGYLWAGDYFKGTSKTAEVDNNYLLMHQLTLSF